jgi:hypothetical protein
LKERKDVQPHFKFEHPVGRVGSAASCSLRFSRPTFSSPRLEARFSRNCLGVGSASSRFAFACSGFALPRDTRP